MIRLGLLMMLVGLAGCETAGKVKDLGEEKYADVVEKYCVAFDAGEKARLRDWSDEVTAPDKVRIECGER